MLDNGIYLLQNCCECALCFNILLKLLVTCDDFVLNTQDENFFFVQMFYPIFKFDKH